MKVMDKVFMGAGTIVKPNSARSGIGQANRRRFSHNKLRRSHRGLFYACPCSAAGEEYRVESYRDVAGKKLLIIGSDASNVHIIDQAKKMGVRTIAVDWETDHSKCPAKLAADEAWDMSYRDIDALSQRAMTEHVDGVLAGYAEYRVLCAAKIAQNIGSPFYVTPEQMELTRSKRNFKTLCAQYGIPVPHEYCHSGVLTDAEKDAVQYPVIVKPSDYGGRIGISVCYDRAELDRAVEEALRFSESKSIVVEEYIRGTELMALYTISNGEISLSMVNDKYLSHEGHMYDTLCEVALMPSRYCGRYIETVDEQVRAFLQGIGMKNGVAFFQLIANDEKIAAFEMGLRLNGGNDWKLIQNYNGVNYCEMLIRHSLTGKMGGDLSKDNPWFKEFLCTFVMYCHGGEVGFVDDSALRDHSDIVDVHPYLKVGKVMPDNGTTQQKAYSIKIRSRSLDELKRTIRFIQEHVVVKDTDGRNMLFQPFDGDRLGTD